MSRTLLPLIAAVVLGLSFSPTTAQQTRLNDEQKEQRIKSFAPSWRSDEQCNITQKISEWRRDIDIMNSDSKGIRIASVEQSLRLFSERMKEMKRAFERDTLPEISRRFPDRLKKINADIASFTDISQDLADWDGILYAIAAASSELCWYCRLYPSWEILRSAGLEFLPEETVVAFSNRKDIVARVQYSVEALVREGRNPRLDDPATTNIIDGLQRRIQSDLSPLLPDNARYESMKDFHYSKSEGGYLARGVEFAAIMRSIRKDGCVQTTPLKRDR